jgi:hypothetical protein
MLASFVFEHQFKEWIYVLNREKADMRINRGMSVSQLILSHEKPSLLWRFYFKLQITQYS